MQSLQSFGFQLAEVGIICDEFMAAIEKITSSKKTKWITNRAGQQVAILSAIPLWGNFLTTSADVTLNGGLIRELPQNPLNSGLGNILICPDSMISSTLNSCEIRQPFCVNLGMTFWTNVGEDSYYRLE